MDSTPEPSLEKLCARRGWGNQKEHDQGNSTKSNGKTKKGHFNRVKEGDIFKEL